MPFLSVNDFYETSQKNGMSEESFRTFFITHVYLTQHAIYYEQNKVFQWHCLEFMDCR